MKVTIVLTDQEDGTIKIHKFSEENNVNDENSDAVTLGNVLFSPINFDRLVKRVRRETWYDRIATASLGAIAWYLWHL